jgi:predicted transcriptional regulator YdeE
LQKIPGKISHDIFAVYTNFENSGKNNEGSYSLIIGAQVSARGSAAENSAAASNGVEVPAGLVGTTIPACKRLVFDVEKGRMDMVGRKWVEIWNYNEHRKSYVSDYERYKESGEIAIFVGVG